MKAIQRERCREAVGLSTEDSQPCSDLWMGVITQAMWDAASARCRSSYRKKPDEAIAWFKQPDRGSDFATVCELAGVTPRTVRAYVRRVLAGRLRPIQFYSLKRDGSFVARKRVINNKEVTND